MMTSKSTMVRSILLMAVLWFPLHAAAKGLDTLDQGPKVGATIPHSLSALDQHGQHQDFKSLARRRGLIILFSRSLDW
jgi:hypothetical protein